MCLTDLGTYVSLKTDEILKIDLALLNLSVVFKLTWLKKKMYSVFSEVLSQRINQWQLFFSFSAQPQSRQNLSNKFCFWAEILYDGLQPRVKFQR